MILNHIKRYYMILHILLKTKYYMILYDIISYDMI
jgi:hypothetical protein